MAFFDNWTVKYARLIDMLVPNAINGPTAGTFRTRAKDRITSERLVQEIGPLEEWHPDTQELVQGIEDAQVRQREETRWQHVVVSRTFLPRREAVRVLTAELSHPRTSTIVSYDTAGQAPSTKAAVG